VKAIMLAQQKMVDSTPAPLSSLLGQTTMCPAVWLAFWITSALIAFAGNSVSAQQQEAMLQKVEIPGAAFDLVVAMPKTPGAVIDLNESPDALVIHLAGSELALGFESAEQMLITLDSLRSPVGAVHVRRDGVDSPIPVTVYMVRKGGFLASAKK